MERVGGETFQVEVTEHSNLIYKQKERKSDV